MISSQTPPKLFKSENDFYLPSNISNEEKIRIFRETAIIVEEERKRKNEENKRNTPKIKFQLKREFNYWDKLNIKKEDVPSFMLGVFQAIFISDEEKEKFINQFCKFYINNEIFRNNTNGKYLFFLNNILVDIISNENEIDYSNRGDTRLIVKIGEEPLFNGYGKVNLNPNYYPIYSDEGEQITDNVVHAFKLNAYVSGDNNFDPRKFTTSLCDSGADISPILFPEIWNFQINKFVDENVHNFYFKFCKPINISTCNGVAKEYYVSLEGLDSVPIYEFTIPQYDLNIPELKSSFVHLIGMNIISQHILIFAEFNNVYRCKIMNKNTSFSDILF